MDFYEQVARQLNLKLAKNLDGTPLVVVKQDVTKLLRERNLWHYKKNFL